MRLARSIGGLLGFGVWVGLALGADEATYRRQLEMRSIFERADADNDGRMTREEFAPLAEYAPRLRGNPALIDQTFGRLDADHDGSVSLEEYLKVAGRGQAPSAQEKGKPLPAQDGNPVDADAPITPDQLTFFESKVRPLLVAHCYKCHSASSDKVKGGLVLDTRDGIRKGGDTGPAVVPGNAEDSLLIQAVRSRDEALQMPPKEKLPESSIADLERWVAMGAPDPRVGAAPVVSKGIDIDKGREFWAFQPPREVPPPPVVDETWGRSEIDRFLLARLEGRGLKPVGDAERSTLIRRISFDLIGLPPSEDEVTSFMADDSPEAFARV